MLLKFSIDVKSNNWKMKCSEYLNLFPFYPTIPSHIFLSSYKFWKLFSLAILAFCPTVRFSLGSQDFQHPHVF